MRLLQNKWFLSFSSAILLIAAWPRDGFAPLLLVALIPFFFLDDQLLKSEKKRPAWRAFRWGYFTFFIWNVVTTWWIWNSTPFGAIMAILLNSLFQAFVYMAYFSTRKALRMKAHGLLLFPLFWIAFEWWHMNWDLSWPWLNLGNGFGAYPMLVQWYEYTGILGGSMWVLLVNILAFFTIKGFYKSASNIKDKVLYASSLIVLLIVPIIVSLVIYSRYKEKGSAVEVVVVQPNHDPWTEQYGMPQSEILKHVLELGASKAGPDTRYIVYPESTLYDDIWVDRIDSTPAILSIKNFLRQYPKLSVIIGSSTYEYYGKEKKSETARTFSDRKEYYDAYNTAICIDSQYPSNYYHKSKLVPGPEKLPFPSLLRPLQDVAFNLGGTVGSLGLMKERRAMGSPFQEVKVGVAICYESIYGEFVSGYVKNGAGLIFVITNDGWWGNTAGHRQHLVFSSLRSIETRRDIARSANTGISAFINQKGEILDETPYWKEAVIKQTLHANQEITFYVQYGDYIGRIAGYASVLLFLGGFVQRVIKKKGSLAVNN
ncbi:MAG: apolipoprotein N-acyltransferase [Sphingobacteriia bacterium]|nr:apolipoprotein N-acyltransferase [Sphingobacteriia bacterium]